MFGYIRAKALPSVNEVSLKVQLLSSLKVGVTWMGLGYSGYSRICRNATPCLDYWHKRSNTPALLGPSSVSMLTTALVSMLTTSLQMSTNDLQCSTLQCYALFGQVKPYFAMLCDLIQHPAISYLLLWLNFGLPNIWLNMKLQKLIYDR